MKIRMYGIRQYVTWLTLVPLLIMALSLESFFLHAQFADMDRDMISRGQLIVRQLAASSEYGVFSNNRTFLASVARSALREADVKAVILLNAATEVMVAAGEMPPQADSLFRSASLESRILDDGSKLFLYQPILSTQIALEDAEVQQAPRQIGAVIMAMSWQRMQSLKSRLFWLTITATAGFFLLTLFLVSLANRPIIESIRGLSRAVAAIGTGDFNTRVAGSSHVSELGTLENGINHMVAELQQDRMILQTAHEQLDQANRNLEQTVAERTHQLSVSLEQVQSQKLTLQESEARFRRVIEAAPIPIMIHVEDGSVLSVNRALTKITGYRLQDIPTVADWVEKAHGELSEMVLQKIKDIFQLGVSGGEYLIRCHDGTERLWEISSVKLGQIAGGQYAAISIAVDITERKQQEQLRLEKERTHRDTLVREVHHRIKNNLQSVAGLLQRELGKYLELNPRLETAISQVNVIAVVHGLQGVDPSEAIGLREVVQNICKSVSSLAQHPVLFDTALGEAALPQITINHEEAVAVALILNELILNAVKHSPQDSSSATVTLSSDGSSARLLIRNTPRETPKFDIDTGSGLGTGLSLVRSLLPEQGAQLGYELDAEGCIVATVRLAFPVVVMAQQNALRSS